MDLGAHVERLEPTCDDPAELIEHLQHRRVGGRDWYVLGAARHGVERGTVIDVDAATITRGYPSIPRVLLLRPGIVRHFENTAAVAIEEKLNGANVRIVHDDNDPVAITRGGFRCPFTTARARSTLALPSFFADHPSEMLCAELIGPESPYTSTAYEDVRSAELRVFDIRDRVSGRPLPVERRRTLCERYDVPQPRLFGVADPGDCATRVRNVIEDLHEAGREGVVLRSPDGTSLLKYTTEAQHHDDLAYAFADPFDQGRDYLFSRVVRDAFQSYEFDEEADRRRERAHALGEAILLPMVAAIEAVEAEGSIGQHHTVRGQSEPVEALLDHLRDQSIDLRIRRDRTSEGERIVEFLKVARPSTDRIRHLLETGIPDE